MSDNTELNPGYGGDIYAADDIGGIKFQRVKLVHGADGVNDGDVATGNGLPVVPANITGKFRESFENFTPGVNWNLTTGSGDIVQTDGNSVSASYLVISKDPLSAGTETVLTYNGSFPMPIETAAGLSMSQRVVGQELSVELVSTEDPIPLPSDLTIASISQTTTTLTVTTTGNHGLIAGMRVGIYGVVDTRLNYPSLVVMSTNTPTQFTCTAGPGGTIPSITAGPYTNQGFVYYRSALGGARNGMSEIFENSATTNASLYVRSASGDVLPSGAANANQSVTVSSTASNQAVLAAYTYSFLPTSEYRFVLQADRAQWMDVTVDSTGMSTTRLLRTQVVPDPTQQYTLRFRATNVKGLSTPAAKIVSAVKSGSTTTTITTAAPHGLQVGEYAAVIGIRDQINFAGTLTNLQVLSVISPTQFTTAFGATATATSYGGCVVRQQGSNMPAGYGTPTVQNVTGANGALTINGVGNWAFTVGDYVNLYGVRVDGTGADLGVDGVYKCEDVSTTNCRLIPIGGTPTPATFALTNCGGTIIKRTDVRLAFVRIFEYVRERVELLANGASAASVPVFLNGGTTAVSSGSITPISSNTYALLTSTNLAASATYSGSATNIASSTTSATVYFTQIVVGVQHTAGQTPGQLYLDIGTETSSTAPTTWYQALAVPIPSSANWTYFSVPVSARYYRVRFVNGPVAQTSFRLATYQTYNGGGLSGQLAYPQQLYLPISTTTIGVSGVQTSVGLDFGDTMNVYKTITFTAYADQASATNGFQVQVSRDNSNWRVAAQTTVTAATLSTLTVQLVYRYVRVVYTNGTVAQTSFQMDARAEVG